jgi:uncharacterized membrane protein
VGDPGGELMGVVHWITRLVEIVGIGVILAGLLISTAGFLRRKLAGGAEDNFHRLRSDLGRSILLGLEFLVAADIINTVAIEPTLESVVVLAGIVLIRTFLSFSLEVEIEGRWPWQASRSEPGPSAAVPTSTPPGASVPPADNAEGARSAG